MSKSVNVDFVTRQIEVDTDGKEHFISAAMAAKDAEQSMLNAQNAANAAEAVAPEYARTKEVLDNIVSYTNTVTEQANIATAKANAANVSATNAAQSYANADDIAAQLTEYLATKENLTAPAVDKTLLIEGAAADSKVSGNLINARTSIAGSEITYYHYDEIVNNSLKINLQTSQICPNEIAIGEATYNDIFNGKYTRMKYTFDDGTYNPGKLNAGNPIVTDEKYLSKGYSLKCFGSTSQQLYGQYTMEEGHYYWYCCAANVVRYTSGWAGMLDLQFTNVTDGFEKKSIIILSDRAAILTPFFGSGALNGEPGNSDSYIDSIFVIDITDLFDSNKFSSSEGVVEINSIMMKLYDNYVDLVNSFSKTLTLDESNEILKKIEKEKIKDVVFVGAVLDANSAEDRFLSMKQLLDIAKKKYLDNSYVPSTDEFNLADKGIVGVLPNYNCSMYQNYEFEVLYSKNKDVTTLPASVTKVVSLITGMDYITSIKETVKLEEDDIQEGSGNYFSAGDIMTIEELMLGMMLPSSNTCAMAFAHVCGKKIINREDADTNPSFNECVSAFVTQMNKKVASIGCTNSTFNTPSGLSKTNFSCVADLFRIIIEACSYNEILKVWGKKKYTISLSGTNPREVILESTVTNNILEQDYYILGGKTGSLDYGDGTVARALVMIAKIKNVDSVHQGGRP